jgi:FkbM family methyltransferase
MKVFLDIGAHNGETLLVVREPEWCFDRIVCFEPAPVCWPKIEALADSRVELCRFGLWKGDATIDLHNPGQIGASMSADKDEVTDVTPCDFRDAARWFADNLTDGDEVYAKINAEGAEVDIIDNLAMAGVLRQIDHLLLHFDIRKIPSLRSREPAMRAALEAADVEYQPADEIQFGVVGRGTRNWLRWCISNPRTRNLRYKTLGRLGHRVRLRLYPVKQIALRLTD